MLRLLICMLVLFGLQTATVAEDGLLFDGKTLDNWTTLDGEPVTSGWEVVDGMIHLRAGNGKVGHIITRQKFGDFRLRFQWKIAAGGNGGLKYRVRHYGGKWRGCEYQIIDDQRYKKTVMPRNSVGALYDLFAPNENKQVKPLGQFNSSEILVSGDRIIHWLNGMKILSVSVGDAKWDQRVAESKFSDLHDFGENQRGRIMLTDHRSEVWYRNFDFQLLSTASE